jgi:hypothetical protein
MGSHGLRQRRLVESGVTRGLLGGDLHGLPAQGTRSALDVRLDRGGEELDGGGALCLWHCKVDDH